MFAGILVLAVAGLALDRFYLGVTGPDSAAAAQGAQQVIAQPSRPTPSPVRGPSLASHLRSISLTDESLTERLDAFSGHQAWLPQAPSRGEGHGPSEPHEALPSLRLTAILGAGTHQAHGRTDVVLAAVINNQTVPVGGTFDVYTLREIGERWVVVSDGARAYRVSLPDSTIEVLGAITGSDNETSAGR